MIYLFTAALAFDALLLSLAPWLLFALLAIGVPLLVVAGVAMHAYPRRLVR